MLIYVRPASLAGECEVNMFVIIAFVFCLYELKSIYKSHKWLSLFYLSLVIFSIGLFFFRGSLPTINMIIEYFRGIKNGTN